MAQIIYTKTEQMLLDRVFHLDEMPTYELERLAETYDSKDIEELWVAVELGRHSSTDERTYTLHTYYSKPEFDYYGAEQIKG